MKTFRFRCAVREAHGWQEFTVHAANAREATLIFKNGGGEFLDEEVEVTALEEPELVGEEEVQ